MLTLNMKYQLSSSFQQTHFKMIKIYCFLLLLVISSTLNRVFAQFTHSETLDLSIDLMEATFNYGTKIYVTIKSKDCTLPSVGFSHVYPTFALVSANNHEIVHFEKEAMFISVNEENCINGSFATPSSIEIPSAILDNNIDFVLILTLKYGDTKEWKTMSKPFSQSDIKVPLTRKKNADSMEINNLKSTVEKSLITFAFKSNNTMKSNVSMTIHLFKDEKECGRSETIDLPVGIDLPNKISIPYTKLYLPPGDNNLKYKIFASTSKEKEQLLYTGNIAIHQPQLYRLSFKSTNADIDVREMDQPSSLGKLFSKNGGLGQGDAFFEIINDETTVFRSPHVNQSGKINDQTGVVQIYLNKKSALHFLDLDVMKHDLIEVYDLQLNKVGLHKINIKKGRIHNFDFEYNIEQVTAKNYALNYLYAN